MPADPLAVNAPRRRGCLWLKLVAGALGLVLILAASAHRDKPRRESHEAGLTNRVSVEMAGRDGRRRRVDVYWDELKGSRAAHRIVAYLWNGPLEYSRHGLSVGNGMRLIQVGVRKGEGGDRLVLLAELKTGGLFEAVYALDQGKLARKSVRTFGASPAKE